MPVFESLTDRRVDECVTATRVTFTAQPSLEVLGECAEWVSGDHVTSSAVSEDVNSRASGLLEFVALRFFKIPAVVAVAFLRGEYSIHVWTIVQTWDEQEAERVYDLELEILSRFPGIGFDFYVLAKDDRDVSTFLPSSSYVIFRDDDQG